jgi:hypothetical protein
MGKAKKHTPKQIVNVLRQIEVAVSNGKTAPMASHEAGIPETKGEKVKAGSLPLARASITFLTIPSARNTNCM